MGEPLSCIIADIFMEEYEKQINFKIDGKKIDIDLLRYRDDTLGNWEYTLDNLMDFWRYLNGLRPIIKWDPPVVEVNGVTNFLDVLIKRNEDNTFTTAVYRKTTHSDRYLHFSSNHPLEHKISGIMSLKCRAEKYCSTPALLQEELNHILKVFKENGYPEALIRNCLFKKRKPKDNNEEEEYVGSLYLPYIRQMEQPLKKLCSKLKIKLIFNKGRTLKNILASHRPPIHDLCKKNVIYRASCGGNDGESCDTVYVGETSRQLGTRMNEQATGCIRAKKTGKVKDKDKRYDLGLQKHALDHNHIFNLEEAEILDQEKHWKKRKILEAIHIALQPNTCNINKGAPFDPSWLQYISAFSQLDDQANFAQPPTRPP